MPSEPYERAVWAPAIDDALLTAVYQMVLASGGDVSTVEYDDMPHQDVLVRCW